MSNDFESRILNAEYSWDKFHPETYWKHNYLELLPEDRQIMHQVSGFLVEYFRDRPRVGNAVDIGAGSNLYPALLMLPWADHITFTDYSQPNVDWLTENLSVDRTDRYGQTDTTTWRWQPFWDEVAGLPGYREVSRPRELLESRHRVERLDVFELPIARWDLGAMFFVADGITKDTGEFRKAVESFLHSLKPGSPFVAAFMKASEGYRVRGEEFPAVSIDEQSLDELLGSLEATEVRILATDDTDKVVRSGYKGMMVVTGTTCHRQDQRPAARS